MEGGNRFGKSALGKRISVGGQDQQRDFVTPPKHVPQPTETCGMAVMAKASAPGRTKTRLVPPLSFDEAAALNTAFVQDVADNLLLAGCHAGIADACLPSLGDCLLSTSREIFARGHGSAVLLNADSPTLPTGLLIEAANVLAQPGERTVLGPASDGGYYLLGLKTVHRRLFEDIAWSTEYVAAQTLERAREINLDVHVLPAWYDVDDVEDLRRLSRDVWQLRSSGRELDLRKPHYPVATAALLANLELGSECSGEDFARAEGKGG